MSIYCTSVMVHRANPSGTTSFQGNGLTSSSSLGGNSLQPAPITFILNHRLGWFDPTCSIRRETARPISAPGFCRASPAPAGWTGSATPNRPGHHP